MTTRLNRPARLLSMTVFVAVIAIAAVACGGGGSFSTNPADYIPSEIDGDKVTTDGVFAEQIMQQFTQEEGIDEVVVASVGGTTDLESLATPNPDSEQQLDELLPKVVLISAAATGDSQSLDEIVGQGGEELKTETIEGTEVKFLEAGEGDTQIAFAIAEPAQDVQIVAFTFSGGEEGAKQAITAMLNSGS